MIFVDSNEKKKKIDYDIEEILAEFADRETGLSSLADKYRVHVGDLPAPKKQKRASGRGEAASGVEEPLPGGHRVVYEDKSLSAQQGAGGFDKEKQKTPPTASSAPSAPGGVRVVYDADAQKEKGEDSLYDFSSFEDIVPPNTDSQKATASQPQKPSQKKTKKSSQRASEMKPAAGKEPRSAAPRVDANEFQSFDDLSAGSFDLSEQKKVQNGAGGRKPWKQSLFARFFFSFVPRRGDSAGEVFRKIVLTVSSCVLIGTMIFFVQYFLDKEPEIPQPSEITTDEHGTYVDPRNAYPDIDFPEGLQDRFVNLYAQNQDFVGWVSVNGKNRSFDSLVVQEKSKTDSAAKDFYLKHDFYKNETRYGSPFMDFRNDSDANDTNTIIYAHNMMDGNQFALIEDYVNDIETLKQNPAISYQPWNAPEPYVYKIYAVFVANAQKEQDNGYVFAYHTPRFMNEEAFLGYKRMLDLKTIYTTGVDLNLSDKILTLSTCGYDTSDFQESRYVIVARKLRAGEDAAVDVSKIQANPSPWYPQAWYDKRRMENPYADTEKWYEY
ncbi:MAG: class B sortase [Oscillospiraceae bacterium]|nr:class B sortase [Oscillospiraceae bacterium]